MTESPPSDFVDRQLRSLRQAIAERAASEDRLRREYGGVLEDVDAQHQRTLDSIAEKYDAEESNATRTHAAARDAALKRFEAHFQVIQKDYQTQKQSNREWYETERERLEQEENDAGWMVSSMLDTQSSDGPYRELKTLRGALDVERKELREKLGEADVAYREVVELLTARRQWRDFHEPVTDAPAEERNAARGNFDAAYQETTRAIHVLKTDTLSRLVAGWGFLLLLVVVFAACFGAMMVVDPTSLPLSLPQDLSGWTFIAAAAALIPTAIAGFLLFGLNRARVGQMMRRLQTSSVRARRAHQRWRDLTSREMEQRQGEYKRWHASVTSERKAALERIQNVSTTRIAACETRRNTTEEETERRFTERLDQLSAMRDGELAVAEEQLRSSLQHLRKSREKAVAGVTDGYERMRRQHVEEEAREFAEIGSRWTAALETFQVAIDEFNDRCDEQTAVWQHRDDADWELPSAVPDSLRFGRVTCNLRDLPNGLSDDERLRTKRDTFDLPAALSFPQCGSMLFGAKGEGLNKAVDAMRAVMLRFLTSLPPGKIRFTVIDPAGMGEAFAGFMHLTDYDPLMIGNRIWTESGQIEKRLAELSEHMENIFQAYLRNEFATIDEYNKQAHEVAEPYHVLVVASFPTNFTESAARRLANIAASGSRCGVYTLISIDESLKPPHDCDFTKLESDARVLQWKKDRFALRGESTANLPLTLDEPPAAEDFGRIVRAAGAKHQNARRVEVPFERIAPRPEEVWAKDSRAGIDVPLGRAGATKLQYLRLGRGTSQHVLVAGKTGAGKSSFLHAFITNLALHYGPDEVEFYLVDFKKGVEFKTYAANNLPHARVIGIESDREFGVSVLERLDGILKERGELFRQHGVQDIESFRNAESHGARPVGLGSQPEARGSQPEARGSHPAGLPRIMLVVDEFQEFFVEDDSLSQSASLLLDRLVRQGRAFGIHVLLGSQTLGGAYSLARSTLGQVAVRIALQCSESDAHLILSEENTAARLLTRPGEAIYNDANGLVEGNHPFQIAWLPDKQRESSLRQMQRRAQREEFEFAPAIVFEGNVASDARRNRDVVKLFEEYNADDFKPTTSPTIWLGEAVSITEPTRIQFQPRPGDNLLIVGRNSKDAHGLLGISFLTLAAQAADAGDADTSLLILDGESLAPDDGPGWEALIEAVPHAVTLANASQAAAAIADVAALVEQRIETNASQQPPVFLLISDLSRFRDLRNEGDNYGFPGFDSDAPPNPGTMLAEILRDGPAVGVHSLVWCDNATNLTRWFGHTGLREFELRIAFQMNSTDSSNLIDTPAAARLGAHRALLYRGETGGCEKFRPYAAPNQDWLANIADQLHGRETQIATWDDLAVLTVT